MRGRVALLLVICLFPPLGVQMIVLEWGAGLVRERVYSAAYANVEYLRSHFGSNMAILHTTAEYLCSVDIIRELFVYDASYNTSDYYEKIEDIQNFLYRMSQSNPFIREIRLYYPRRDVMLYVLRTGRKYLTHSPAGIEQRIHAYRNASSLLIEEDGEYRVSAMLGGVTVDQQLAFYFEIIIDTDVMVQHLSSFTAGGEKLSFQYDHTTDTVLFSNGKSLRENDALVYREAFRMDETLPYAVPFRLENTDYVMVASASLSINTTFAQLIPTHELEALPHKLRIGMYLFVVLFTLMFILYSIVLNRQINRPIKRLLSAFDATGEGKFGTRIADDIQKWPTEYQQLTQHFNKMNTRIEMMIAEVYEQKLHLRSAQLKQLQAQINPHFLYNSFFLLRSVIGAKEYEQAERFLGHLGSYFAYVTNNNSELASIKEEYEHAQNYLDIQAMRFEDQLELNIAPLPMHLEEIAVPRLILQPLYENVLLHGKWEVNDIRRINLDIKEENSIVTLCISDNGKRITDSLIGDVCRSLTDHIPVEFTSGMANIHHRLSLLGLGCGLSVCRSSLSGFEVNVHLTKERRKHV